MVENYRTKRQSKPIQHEHFDVQLVKIMTKYLSKNSKNLTKEVPCGFKSSI